jgi:hypothetical protein
MKAWIGLFATAASEGTQSGLLSCIQSSSPMPFLYHAALHYKVRNRPDPAPKVHRVKPDSCDGL